MKLFLLIAVGLIVSGCTNPLHIREADRIMNKFNENMRKDGFNCYGSGGAMVDDIKKICLHYQIYEPVPVETARNIIVSKTENLLSIINNDMRIRPYLHDFPFTSKNIDWSISYLNRKADTSLVVYAYLLGETNKIHYRCFQDSELQKLHDESYEDALQIYNQSQQHQIPVLCD